MKTETKIILGVLGLVILIGVVGLFQDKTININIDNPPATVNVNDGVFGGGIDLDRYRQLDVIGTTSPTYLLTTTASSSLIVSLKNAKHIDLNIALIASTTGTILNWNYQFSYDDGANKNWFYEDAKSTTGALTTHQAASTMLVWTPANAVASTTYKNIGIQPVASKYMKIDFSVSGDNGGLYVEGITQSDTNN